MIVTGAEVVSWVAERAGVSVTSRATALGWMKDKLMAGVIYDDFNGANMMTHIAGEGKRWMTREYLWTIFSYPFDLCGVKRITATVAEGNEASQLFVEHLGFTLEAELEDAHPTGNMLLYRMMKKDCRFLDQKRFSRLELKAA